MANLPNVKLKIFFTILCWVRFSPTTLSEEVYLSRYEQIRQFFPSVSPVESRNWQMQRDMDQPHPCRRECVANVNMTCYYHLVVHPDETMGPTCQRLLQQKQFVFRVGKTEFLDGLSLQQNRSFEDCKYADGVKSDIFAVNGQLPGPPIEVCLGDTIVADVMNGLLEATTLHWHGLPQRQTPYMDGAPYITQYPIAPGQAYRYRFELDRVGTNYWHSHMVHQRAFGMAGALIIRQPEAENPHAGLYDYDLSEHVLLLQDWVHNFDANTPQNLLINGRGRNVDKSAKNPTLFSSFSVRQNARYRFRVIFNGIVNCPVSLSIDQHDLLVIATDGHDVEPVLVQKLTFTAGERYDFVLDAQQQVSSYWIRLKGYKFCETNQLHQQAILHYEGAKRLSKPKPVPVYTYEPKGLELNAIDQDKHITVQGLKSLLPYKAVAAKKYHTFYTTMDITLHDGSYLFQIDGISFTPSQISLLQARNLGADDAFCNKTQQLGLGFNCRSMHCRCLNVLELPAGQHVEFVISSSSATGHPIHLHGYSFRIVGMGILGEQRIQQIEQIDREQPLPRRSKDAPLKDTVQVPAFGYTIIRFYTDNPGYWLMHCHHSPHAENGMAAVLRVGAHADMKLCPVSNCGLCVP